VSAQKQTVTKVWRHVLMQSGSKMAVTYLVSHNFVCVVLCRGWFAKRTPNGAPQAVSCDRMKGVG
jgi:hypothetical protein